jgi:hypothetical protein
MTDVTERNFVVFMSPGTFVDEISERPIGGWSVAVALELAAQITERHGAKPCGFRFETRLVAAPVDDGRGGKLEVRPRTIKTSGMYFIDGRVFTLAEIEAHPEYGPDSILAGNMRGNGWMRVVETRNGYRHMAIVRDGDRVVDSKTSRGHEA